MATLFARIIALLRWQAFFRSLLFTTVVSAIWLYEIGLASEFINLTLYVMGREPELTYLRYTPDWYFLLSALFNAPSDYLALFVIRPLLVRSGTKPVIGLALGAVSGVVIVLAVNSLRLVLTQVLLGYPWTEAVYILTLPWPDDLNVLLFDMRLLFVWPALAIFIWLPLLALGIVVARLLTPLSWIVGRTQWFLKEGKEHPLKAIGYVAAVAAFICTVTARAAFSA